MDILPLTQLEDNFNQNWGNSGYATGKVFEVATIYDPDKVIFHIYESDRHYEKQYQIKAEQIFQFNQIIKHGHSLGAFIDNQLVGILIGEIRQWNNSFYIETILVSERHRRNGVGGALIKQAIKECKIYNCRLIELETQNTNFPAVQFYLQQGFRITGINSMLYNDESTDEIALFMTHENKNFGAGT